MQCSHVSIFTGELVVVYVLGLVFEHHFVFKLLWTEHYALFILYIIETVAVIVVINNADCSQTARGITLQ